VRVEERGKGAGHDSGKPVICPTAKANHEPKPHTHVYYGRGYVQLTWRENYIKMGEELGLDLAHQPDLALNPRIAYDIASVGMRKGMFRSSQYVGITSRGTHARSIH